MMESRISIVLPTYNSEKTLDLCFRSLVNLDYDNFEVIVVDDGSKDKTITLIKEFKKSKIGKKVKTLFLEGVGISKARNLGSQRASGKLILFIDPDCILQRELLKEINEKFEADKSLDVLSGAKRTWNRGSDLARFAGYELEVLYDFVMKEKIPLVSTHLCVCRKKVFKKVEFDEKIKVPSVEDIKFGLDAAKFFNVKFDKKFYVPHINEENVVRFFKKRVIAFRDCYSFFFLRRLLERPRDLLKIQDINLKDVKYFLRNLRHLLFFSLMIFITIFFGFSTALLLSFPALLLPKYKFFLLLHKKKESFTFMLKSTFYILVEYGASFFGLLLSLNESMNSFIKKLKKSS